MEKTNTAISTKYAVSEQTAGWANLHHAVDRLWGDIYKLLEHEDELQNIDERFSEKFEKPLLALMDAVENGLAESVLENFRTNKNSIVL